MQKRKSSTGLSVGDEEVADAKKVVETAVTKKALVEQFGEEGLTESFDSQGNKIWSYSVKGEKNVKIAEEMDRARDRAEQEMGSKAAAKDAKTHVTIRDAGGRKRKVPERYAEAADRLNHYRRTGKW